MSTALKPIETVYKGYRFRSRLEARWAVFFDALGVRWEYEKEGYDLGPAGWYLPDFWLSTVQMWAEIKPEDFDNAAETKCRALVEQSGFKCLMLVGPPKYKEYLAWEKNNWRGVLEQRDVVEIERFGYLLTDEYIHDEHRFFCAPGGGEWASAKTLHAYAQARQARFEHGEVADGHMFNGPEYRDESARCTLCNWRREPGDNDGW
jgi:hypothetical protein